MFSTGAINLGAPILAYEAAVTLDGSASDSTSYTPVIISSPSYSQDNTNDQNEFNPDLDFV